MNFEFLNGTEYSRIVKLGNQLQGLLEKGAYVSRDERQQSVSSFEQAIEWLTKNLAEV